MKFLMNSYIHAVPILVSVPPPTYILSLKARVYKKGKESVVLHIAVCKHPLKSTEVNVTSVAKCYVIITANTSR